MTAKCPKCKQPCTKKIGTPYTLKSKGKSGTFQLFLCPNQKCKKTKYGAKFQFAVELVDEVVS